MNLLGHRSKEFQIHCFFLEDGPMVNEAKDLGYATYLYKITHLTDIRNYIGAVFRLRSVAKKVKPVAVLSWMAKAHMYAGLAFLGSNVKRLWYQHSTGYPDRMASIALSFPSSMVLCCSQAAEKVTNRINARRTTAVCYPGVIFPAGEVVSASNARRQLNISQDGPLIGMVARLERWKGHLAFVEAAAEIGKKWADAHFFVLGGEHPRDPGYADEVREAVRRSGLGTRFLLLGQRPMSEVSLWLSAATLMVHPARSTEPFGMAIAEAMGMGKVVVATGEAGPREMITDRVNGRYLGIADGKEIGTAVAELLSSPEDIKRMEAAAFQRGREFSVANFAARLDSLVMQVCSR